MMVYVVTKQFYDGDDEWNELYVESVEKVFAAEEDAVDYIRESIKDDRKEFDCIDPLEEAEGSLVRDYEDIILEGVEIRSFKYFGMTLSYVYKAYELK